MDIELKNEVNSQLLMEELAERFPQWVKQDDLLDPYLFSVMFYDDGTVVLRVPDDADLDAVKEVVNKHDATKLDRRSRIRKSVIDAASSVVGLRVSDLTLDQLKSVITILLYQEDAIDEGGVIQSLQDWVR